MGGEKVKEYLLPEIEMEAKDASEGKGEEARG